MRRVNLKVIACLVLVGCVVVFLVHRRYEALLEAEKRELSAHTQSVAELQSENARLAVLRGQTSLTASQLTDLMRLRAEVARLLREKKEYEALHTPKSFNEQTNVTSSQVTLEQPVTRDAWQFTGYRQPGDAFQSVMWAMKAGDVGTYLASLTPEGQESAIKRFEGKSYAEISEFLQNQTRGFGVIRLDRINNQSETETSFVLISHETDNGEARTRSEALAVFKRIGDEWKSSGLH